MITLDLPYPPSANRLWRAVGGRAIKSSEYRRWLALAAASIPLAARGRVHGAHTLDIAVDRPDRRARDLDNTLKPIIDALKPDKKTPAFKGVIRDDSDTLSMTVRWTGPEPVKNAKVRITVYPVIVP